MDPQNRGELSPEELAGEIAEALPERAAMSTVSMTGLDAATGTVEAVSDGVTESAAGTADPAPEMATTAAPEVPADATPESDVETTAAPETETTAAPEPVQDAPVQHDHGSANAAQHANEHSAVAQQTAQPPQAATAPAAQAPSGEAPVAGAD